MPLNKHSCTPGKKLTAAMRLLPLMVLPVSAYCADGSLISTYTGGNITWTDTANWTDGIVADGTDAIATMSNNYTSGGTISGITGTLGSLVFEDTTPSNNLLTLSGSLTFATTGATPTISINAPSSFVALNLNLTVSGSQGLTISNVGNTSTRLGNSSNWSGLTGVLTLDGGYFAPQASNKLPGSAGSSVNLTNGANLNPGATSGRSQSIVGLSGASGTSVTIAGSSGYAFGTNSTSGESFDFAGNISGSAVDSSGTITKNGVSTQKLSGTNTYAGTTTINGGTLLVNGTHTASASGGAYVVNSGGVLGGTGTITPSNTGGGTVMVDIKSGGVLAAGDGGIGTLTFDNTASDATILNFSSGASISADLGAGVTSDTIAIIGKSSLATEVFFNNAVINFTDLTSGNLSAGDYLLINGDSNTGYDLVEGSSFTGNSHTGTLISGLSIGSGLDGYTGTLFMVGGTDVYLNIASSAVPEPSTCALLLGASALGLVTYRRRRA